MNNQVALQNFASPAAQAQAQAQPYRMNPLPSVQELGPLMQFCNVLATAPFYQKLTAGGVLAIYLTAREMNLPVMFCLNGGLHNIEGKVVLSAQLMHMMLINAGWEIKFIQMDDKVCHLKFIYPGKNRTEEFKYTVEDAQKAGYFGVRGPGETWAKKPKDNWIYHTLDMLFSRCISSGSRKYAPNVIGNCNGVGELDGDDHILPVSPGFLPRDESIGAPTAPVTTSTSTTLVIDLAPITPDQLSDFTSRHQINKGSEIYDYVLKVGASKKLETFNEALEICCRNEATFIEAFQKMLSKKKAC